ncbi:hypothetical protein ACFXDJ_06720 [Streptomyces sp. NPDC059443]|uniref:hypothetical protein n=1 Tax=unclassified Streptomyces TaxID=2593676 RepID=UPI00369D4B17
MTARTSTAKALTDLVDLVRRTPGWRVIDQRKGSGVTVQAPNGEQASFNIAGAASNAKLPNVQGRLKRMGWDPTAADRAKERAAKKRLAATRQRSDDAIAHAQRDGERRAHAERLDKARTELTRAEAELRASRLAFERAESAHRRAAARLQHLEGVTP